MIALHRIVSEPEAEAICSKRKAAANGREAPLRTQIEHVAFHPQGDECGHSSVDGLARLMANAGSLAFRLASGAGPCAAMFGRKSKSELRNTCHRFSYGYGRYGSLAS